jgi:hypothetical protein
MSDIDKEVKKTSLFFPGFITAALFIVFSMGYGDLNDMYRVKNEEKIRDPKKIIMEIYNEVEEMGQREGEDFLKREFHFDLDGRKENREEHVLIFSYFSKSQQIFSIQITYYEDEGSKNYQGMAIDIKDIDCLITDGAVEIKESSYSKEEMKTLLPQILQGIKKEKELLKMIRKPE